MSPILSLLTLSSLFIYALSHSCGGPEVANSGSNYLELLKDEGSATFNFDATLSGYAGNICLDLGVCTANVNGAASSLYMTLHQWMVRMKRMMRMKRLKLQSLIRDKGKRIL